MRFRTCLTLSFIVKANYPHVTVYVCFAIITPGQQAMKRALIFDFGGVLMKTVDYAPRLRWDDRLGLLHGSVERAVHNAESWVQAQTGAISPAVYWQDVAKRLGLSTDEVSQLSTDFYSGDVLDAALIALIRGYRAEGHSVALLSNDSLELLPKLNRLGITELFDPLVVSAQIGVMKPAAGAYQSVLDWLNLPPQATVFIDDRPENIDGARQLGIHGLHYVAGADLAAQLAPLLSG